MASTFTTVQFMDPPGGPGVTGAIKAGSGITISADGTISTQQGGGIVKTIAGTNGIATAGTTDVIVSLNPPTPSTIGGVRTVDGSGISIDSQGVIRSIAQFSILAGTGISVTNVTPISSTVSVLPAGSTVANRGGVWLDVDSGLSVTSSGALSIIPATANKLGGVKVGFGLSITSDGTLRTTGSSGTITGVTAGTGLSGGGSTGSVTLDMIPATVGSLGGIKVGSGLSITTDGILSASAGSVPTLQQVLTAGATSSLGISFSGPEPGGFTNTINNALIRITGSGGAGDSKIDIDARSSAVPRILIAQSLSMGVDTATGIASIGTLNSGGALRIRSGAGIEFTDFTFGSVWGSINGTGMTVAGRLTVSGINYPTSDGTAGQVLTTNGAGTLSWQTLVAAGALPLTGGIMSGDITFAGTQTFPGVLTTAAASATYAPLASPAFSGTPTATTAAPGTNTAQVATTAFVSSALSSYTPTGFLSLSGGTMTGQIAFAAGQTISGYVANTLYSTTGDIVFASSGNTPARLGIGTVGSILAVNGGTPAWRTSTQLGLLTATSASATYAPLNTPTFTGPVTVNAGGPSGTNAMTISGGNLVLATSFTPSSSSDTGSVGEIAWDNTGYLYFCYAPNTWGRVQIDLTPF